jgi:hypothetical protein
MISFTGFLTEEKNLHLEHLEDEILNNGITGTRKAINFLQALRDMLAGNAKSGVNVTVKWDGAPAVFAGINPENNQFFVGTKSVFNKNAKINYTPEDVDRNHPIGDLNNKLKVALTHLSKLGITDVLQGDLLWYTQDNFTEQVIDGEKYITFQPNTIVYAVPKKDASQILSSKMGIVWHTTYSGDTMEGMSATLSVNMRKLTKTTDVWYSDATYKDTSGTANFNKEETKNITKILSNAGKIFHKLNPKILQKIVEDEKILILVKTFNNTKVKEGQKIRNTLRHARELGEYVEEKYQKEIDKLKRPQSKETKTKEMREFVGFFKKHLKDISNIFEMQNLLIFAKDKIISKLEKAKGAMDTFIRTDDGYRITQPEGFVAVDKVGKAVKLVNRLEFSRANFTAATKWDK